ncbi:MAG: FimV/HubP family polar landmark protein [Thiothrix litoralis]|uniref:FimV/HubP family polar landmark protein n=1 Tax=Thiothrix litoralis TaxID=2891210 RepID=UPI003C758EF9
MQRRNSRSTIIALLVTLLLAVVMQAARAAETYGPIRPGDTLWNIAADSYHGQGVSTEQAMLAILTANPGAFSAPCNVNATLKRGSLLQLPAVMAVQVQDAAAAHQEYARQLRDWQAARHSGQPLKCASTRPETPPSPTRSTDTTPALTNSPVQPAFVAPPLETQTQTALLTYPEINHFLQQAQPHLSTPQIRTLLGNSQREHDMLALAWAIALGLSVGIYLILDGADLGAGILSLFYHDTPTRGAIMASMAGTWDANETWLVVAGGILFGGFPFVYGSVLHYLMFPLMLILLAIILRAISLEFRHHADRSRRWWGWGFGIGSLTVAFSMGTVGGAVLEGVPLTPVKVTYAGGGMTQVFTGGLFDFASAFSLWTGVVGVLTALLAGSLYLRARFEKACPIRHHVKRWATASFYLLLVALAITAVWCYFRFPWVAAKWGGSYAWVWGLMGLWIAFTLYSLRTAAQEDRDMTAMVWFAVAIASVLGTLGATLYPWLVPGSWTIFDAADPSLSLISFTLAMGGFIPVILVYNGYQLWVFRARISSMAAYATGAR